MKKLRFGILSTSSIAPRFIKALQATGTCEAAALASRSLEKAREKAALWNVPKARGSYEELLCSDDIDIAYVAMINSEHYRYAKMALEQGKHVLCEKPFTLSPQESQNLFTLAQEKGLFIMEAQKVLFLPVIQKIKELIEAGSFGPIKMADFSSSFDPGYNTWFFDPEKGGGPLYGNAIYSLQLMQYLFNCKVTGWSGLCTKGQTPVENQFSLSLLMENGLLFTNKTSTAVTTSHTAYLYGEKGFIEIPDYWKARKAILHYHNQAPVVLEYPCDHELMYEALHVEDCIRKGLTLSPVMTEALTLDAITLLTAVQKTWLSS
ncbi:MAG: Gfo/Idh/MocA family oxidoreductase [Lachnospiraceae bacterium]|jgi:predicted dehydrogenase|nr:Gfo/Idh/MocA family oxidoreductase [Lachnospiraceae bacterium]MCI9680817.1 Gfo/Idh/MocA family oxidoreductase [Lachnospiraceae bacterium]